MITLTSINSDNYDSRPNDIKIKYIILHYTEMPFREALEKLCDPLSKVSAHYLVKEDGVIYGLVDEKYRAWHAGISSWRGEEGLNNSSIGIEIDNMGNEDFSDEQIKSCIELCGAIMKRQNIPRENILGHSDIALDRKIDPGLLFPWDKFEMAGMGLLSDKIDASVRPILEVQKQLQNLGYKIEITGEFDKQTNFVFRAFQLRFYQDLIWHNGGLEYLQNSESVYKWDSRCQGILNSLVGS